MNPETQPLPLRDIHLPGAISWWPPAIGWWLLVILFIAAVVFIVWYLRNERMLLTKVAAMSEYNQVIGNFRNSSNKVYLIRELSVVLRRISISFYPHNNVSSLTGDAWLSFLDSVFEQKDDERKMRFQSDTGRLLITAPYEKRSQQQLMPVDELLALCHSWIDNLPKHVSKTRVGSSIDATSGDSSGYVPVRKGMRP